MHYPWGSFPLNEYRFFLLTGSHRIIAKLLHPSGNLLVTLLLLPSTVGNRPYSSSIEVHFLAELALATSVEVKDLITNVAILDILSWYWFCTN
jgi:hypothetical protein